MSKSHTVEVAHTLWADASQFGHPPSVLREAIRLGLKEIEKRQPQFPPEVAQLHAKLQAPVPAPESTWSYKLRWSAMGVVRSYTLDPKLATAVDRLIQVAESEENALCYLESQKNVDSMPALIMDRWGKKNGA